MIFFNIFTAPPGKDMRPRYCIPDIGGHYFVDKSYIELGESEGWLRYSGHYRDANDILVYTYTHLTDLG